MAKFAGKYTLDKEENLTPYLKATGVPDDKIAAVLPLTKTVEIEVDGDNYTLSGALGSKVFPVNKEIEEKFAEHISKSTLSISGKNFVITSVGNDGKKSKRSYEPTAEGLLLSLSREGVSETSKLFYKRS